MLIWRSTGALPMASNGSLYSRPVVLQLAPIATAVVAFTVSVHSRPAA